VSRTVRPYGDASRRDRAARRRGALARHVADATRALSRLLSVHAHEPRPDHLVALAKARRSAEELVRAGWRTGPVPYGYRPHHMLISPYGRRPRHRVRLVVEPAEAFVVWMIFTWHVHDNLTHRRSPTSRPARATPHHWTRSPGNRGTWTTAFVRSVLRNPKYTGWQVWGRRHCGRPLPRDRWVWSDTQAHPTLIPTTLYDAARQPRRATLALAAAEATPRQSWHRAHGRSS